MSKILEVVESELPKVTGKDYKSPVKFELEIQRQRILYILHNAIQKMKIMAHLPTLLKDDGKLLKLFLYSSQVEFVKFACSKYLPGGQIESLKDARSVLKYSRVIDNIKLNDYDQEEDIVKSLLGSVVENQKVDYHISKVIEMITSNKELVKTLEDFPFQVDESTLSLIECMKHLKQLIREKLLITSKEQMDNDKKLRVAYKSNFIITQNIKRLQEQLEKQRKELGSELDKRNATLKSYNDKLESLKDEFQTEMMRTVQKSEKQMMNDSYNSESRQQELEREAHEVTTQYSTLLDSNLYEESQLRQKRNKVEAQLASWLAKYDNDVGEKQSELEKLQKQYDDMKNQHDELMDKYNEQSKEYNILMGEKEAEEQRVYEEMALNFLQNRSARRIQRAWRAYWQRKLERRRGRKGKGKDKKKGKKPVVKVDRKTDANIALEKSFKKKDYLFEEIDTTKQFSTAPVKVDLSA